MCRLILYCVWLHYELKDKLKQLENKTEAVQKTKLLVISLSIRISPVASVIKCNEWDSPLSTLTRTGVLFQLVQRRAK